MVIAQIDAHVGQSLIICLVNIFVVIVFQYQVMTPQVGQ